MMIYDIEWDVDGDEEVLATLPKEVELPLEIANKYDEDDLSGYAEEVSDYLSDTYGFCVFGFQIKVRLGA